MASTSLSATPSAEAVDWSNLKMNNGATIILASIRDRRGIALCRYGAEFVTWSIGIDPATDRVDAETGHYFNAHRVRGAQAAAIRDYVQRCERAGLFPPQFDSEPF